MKQSLVAIGTAEHEHVRVTRALVEALMSMVKEYGYESMLVGSKAKPEFTIRYYVDETNCGGWAILEEACPLPYWRVAEEFARLLDSDVHVVALQSESDGASRLSDHRVLPDGQIELIEEEQYTDEALEDAEDAEKRLVAALGLESKGLCRSTWGYLRRKRRQRRRAIG